MGTSRVQDLDIEVSHWRLLFLTSEPYWFSTLLENTTQMSYHLHCCRKIRLGLGNRNEATSCDLEHSKSWFKMHATIKRLILGSWSGFAAVPPTWQRPGSIAESIGVTKNNSSPYLAWCSNSQFPTSASASSPMKLGCGFYNPLFTCQCCQTLPPRFRCILFLIWRKLNA